MFQYSLQLDVLKKTNVTDNRFTVHSTDKVDLKKQITLQQPNLNPGRAHFAVVHLHSNVAVIPP
jgi:hypothetical protein